MSVLLPPELVGHTLKFVPSPDGNEEQYRIGQCTLHSCALASRTLYKLAQGVLRSAVRICGDHDHLVRIKSALEEDPAFQQGIRTCYFAAMHPHFAHMLILPMMAGVPGVETMRDMIDSTVWFSMEELATLMPGLRSLSINQCPPSFSPSRFFTFLFLRSLHLCSVLTDDQTIHALLSPSTTPSLRTFSFFAVRRLDGITPIALLPVVHAGLLDRLDMVQFALHGDTPDDTLRDAAVPVLHLLRLGELHALGAGELERYDMRHQQLLLDSPPATNSNFVVTSLGHLTTWLLAAAPSRRSLTLPAGWRPSTATNPPEVCEAVKAVLEACEARHVEVMWEEEKRGEFDFRLNHQFWQYARGLQSQEMK